MEIIFLLLVVQIQLIRLHIVAMQYYGLVLEKLFSQQLVQESNMRVYLIYLSLVEKVQIR
ncbi:MAG: hypothetical protein EBT50_06255 [Verrucomicrobia bacterium]|nr:hypothetical protein [Verrucomicrobiota bacterium]